MASIGSKRPREWDVSERLERCVCTEFPPVSPKESGRTKGVYYFEAQLSDGKRSTRVVSFDTAHLVAMKKAADEKTVVAVENCIVKPSTVTWELEVQLHSRSKVISSPRQLSLGEQDAEAGVSKDVKVMDIARLSLGQAISMKCKVMKVGELSSMNKRDSERQLKKQNVKVADGSGQCRLVLWEEGIDVLEEGRTCLLSDVVVREYNFEKYLSYTSQSMHSLADDLEEVDDGDSDGTTDGND